MAVRPLNPIPLPASRLTGRKVRCGARSRSSGRWLLKERDELGERVGCAGERFDLLVWDRGQVAAQ